MSWRFFLVNVTDFNLPLLNILCMFKLSKQQPRRNCCLKFRMTLLGKNIKFSFEHQRCELKSFDMLICQ